MNIFAKKLTATTGFQKRLVYEVAMMIHPVSAFVKKPDECDKYDWCIYIDTHLSFRKPITVSFDLVSWEDKT